MRRIVRRSRGAVVRLPCDERRLSSPDAYRCSVIDHRLLRHGNICRHNACRLYSYIRIHNIVHVRNGIVYRRVYINILCYYHYYYYYIITCFVYTAVVVSSVLTRQQAVPSDQHCRRRPSCYIIHHLAKPFRRVLISTSPFPSPYPSLCFYFSPSVSHALRDAKHCS